MIRIRESTDSALAISTSCCRPIVNSDSGVWGATSSPIRCSTSLAAAFNFRSSITPNRRGSRPKKILAATVKLSARFNSWWISEMPLSIAALTESMTRVLPSTRM